MTTDSHHRPTVTSPADDPRDPVRRLTALFDDGSVRMTHVPDRSGVVAARGRIDGIDAVAFATDPRNSGGALGGAGCARIAGAIDDAVALGRPVIGLWHSGGARLAEGVLSLDGVGSMFAAMVRASGRVPQITVVVGAAAGGAAYGSALTDVVIMAPEGRVFVTGPDVIRSVTGEVVDQISLGGPAVHGRSGVAHLLAGSEDEALGQARAVTTLLSRPRVPGAVAPDVDLPGLLPDRRERAYDVRPLLRGVLDHGVDASTFLELQAKWAPNVVVGFGRLDGRAVGVVANNPLRSGGCLDSASAEKASRFVRLCDAFGLPLVVVVDVPGYLPGVDEEWGGVVRRGAKLLHAFAEASVPRVTLVTRKAFGGAYVAMNSRSLGATAVFAWPGAEIAVMGARAAVGILHRRALAAAGSAPEREALLDRLADEHVRGSGGLDSAVELGVVDAVIEPADTRRRLVEALAVAPDARGAHGNIPL
jgi:acetyl-CoA/propionyl-CoA carboxylase carboxyl transferase subunit